MKAIVVDRWMEPAELKVQEVPEPELAAGTVKIRIRAAGCNFFDTLIVSGKYQVKPPFPFIPGAELAGTVEAVADRGSRFSVGDHVFASVPLGGFAEVTVVPESFVYDVPDGMSFNEAASLPIVYPTSYAALVLRAKLQAGESLVVHAAAGGVGIAAVQIGKALGACVIATAGGDEKLEVARRAGADHLIDYRREDWVETVKRLTQGRGADVIYDPVGGDIFDASMKCIAWNGRLLVIGFAGGRIPEIKANRILLKNIAVMGLHWGAYASREPERVPEVFDALRSLYAKGQIVPVIYQAFPLEQVADALLALASRGTYGKVIIRP